MNFDRLAVPALQGLRAYDPGHDLVGWRRRVGPSLVELGSNENPWGASPAARAAVLDQLHGMHRYPDPLGGDLKRALAQKHGLAVEQLILGNGSHELLMQFAQVFAGPRDQVLMSRYGFAVYQIAAMAVGADHVQAPALPADHPTMPRGHDLDNMALNLSTLKRLKLIFLANPNNPTGTHFGMAALDAFLAQVPEHVIVVLDEAYAEFVDSGETGLSLLSRYPNLIVTRTFSKAYALAGLRVGFAVAHPGLIAVIERVRESFNVNSMGLAAAEAALGDEEHLQWGLARNAEERARLADALRSRGWFVHPSQTNFLLVEFGARTAAIEAGLLDRGVIPRPMTGYGLGDCLRITVGDRDENRRFLDALDALT